MSRVRIRSYTHQPTHNTQQHAFNRCFGVATIQHHDSHDAKYDLDHDRLDAAATNAMSVFVPDD